MQSLNSSIVRSEFFQSMSAYCVDTCFHLSLLDSDLDEARTRNTNQQFSTASNIYRVQCRAANTLQSRDKTLVPFDSYLFSNDRNSPLIFLLMFGRVVSKRGCSFHRYRRKVKIVYILFFEELSLVRIQSWIRQKNTKMQTNG